MSAEDPFVYPGSNVLQNKLNIRDLERLQYYEGALAGNRVSELAENPVKGAHDLRHLRAIHRHIFQDIYPWAGETREKLDLSIGKARPDGSPVSYPTGPMAVAYAQKTLAGVKIEALRTQSADELAKTLAHLYGELDYSHVFREGNSRTLRVFMSSLAREAGHKLSWEHLRNRQEELYRARDAAAFSMPRPELPDPLAPLAGMIREGLDAPVRAPSKTIAAGIDAIRAYAGDGGAKDAPAALRGVFAHLDKIWKDIQEIQSSPKEAAVMFERVRDKVADQFAAGYKFPETGAPPTRSAPRSRGLDDDRAR